MKIPDNFSMSSAAWLALALLALADPAAKADDGITDRAIEGIFRTSARDCTDGGQGVCYFYAEVYGAAAKALFENMRSQEKPDECTGGFVKSDDDTLYCFRSGAASYQCYFGYDFATQEIVIGDFSC